MRNEEMVRLANKAARALKFGWWEDDQTTREIANAEDQAEAVKRLEQIAWDAWKAGEVLARAFFSPWIEELQEAEKDLDLDGKMFFRNWRNDIGEHFPVGPRRRFTSELARIVEGS